MENAAMTLPSKEVSGSYLARRELSRSQPVSAQQLGEKPGKELERWNISQSRESAPGDQEAPLRELGSWEAPVSRGQQFYPVTKRHQFDPVTKGHQFDLVTEGH